VILAKSSRPDHDVDYLFGQVSIDKAFVDWSGNCGNLSAAVGPFAIMSGLVDASRIPPTAWPPCASGKPISARPSSPTCPSPMAKCRKPAISSWTA
jgi:hypothetical protein